jgi:hypothetical protein
MVKSGMVVLTGRENVDVGMGWKVQPAVGIIMGERKREN